MHHHAHVVFDKEERDDFFGANGEQELVQAVALACVQSGGRLVEAEQQRPRAHRPRNLELALLAIRKLACRHIGPPQKIDAVEPIARIIDCLSLGSGKAADMEKGANSRKDAESKNSASWQSGGASQHVVLRHHQVLQYRHAGNRRMFWKVRATRAWLLMS